MCPQTVRDFVFATVKYRVGDWESAPLMPQNIVDSIAKYTALPVAPTGVVVELDSEDLFDFPFAWLTGHLPLNFTPQERINLKKYVQRGGFIVIDDHNHDIDGRFHKSAMREIETTFGAGALKLIPKNHPLYFCFFKFEDGPPTTSHELNGWGDQLVHRELRAIMSGDSDRIGLLYSNKDYSSEWNYTPKTKDFYQKDNTTFAINLIVYALTR